MSYRLYPSRLFSLSVGYTCLKSSCLPTEAGLTGTELPGRGGNCHHQNDFGIKMVSGVTQFNVSSLVIEK